jgi:hypothetical protein
MATSPSSEGHSALPGPPDYSSYSENLAGFTGVNFDEIQQLTSKPAVRSHIGPRGMYKTGLAYLANGDLLACPCTELERGGKWTMAVFRSTDEGKTWQPVETRGDELLGKEPALTALSDGGVLLVTSHPHGFRVSRSDDNGVTWATTPIGGDFGEELLWQPMYEMVRNVVEEPDGSLMLLMSSGKWADRTAPRSQAWTFRSADGGRSWVESDEVEAWDDPEPMFGEVSLVRLPDGRLLAASRTEGDHQIGNMPPRPAPGEAGNHMMLLQSEDGGLSWTEPRTFLNHSEVHAQLLLLQDGRLLCTYATYHLPFGIFAVLSTDSGATWDTDHAIALGISWDFYVGWPTSVQLPDGDVVTAFGVRAYRESEFHMQDQIVQAVRWRP